MFIIIYETSKTTFKRKKMELYLKFWLYNTLIFKEHRKSKNSNFKN
jgi:hypothetical protein